MLNLADLQRFGHFFASHRIPIVPTFVYWLQFLIFNSAVHPSVKIGRGSRFAYGGIGVVIHNDAVIGENVIIGQGVTIGGNLGRTGVPAIMDHVVIAAGARIFGPIIVGRNAYVGANSVVTNNVPENAIVAGAPAKKIGEREDPNISDGPNGKSD